MYYLLNKKAIEIKRATNESAAQIVEFYDILKDSSRNNFAPHKFDLASINSTLNNENFITYISTLSASPNILAYFILKIGCVYHDSERFQQLGYKVNKFTDASFAPAVLDEWQGKGLGSLMFNFITNDLKSIGINRLFLWGGVKKSNRSAIDFYKRAGFKIIDEFEHEGGNYDMLWNFK